MKSTQRRAALAAGFLALSFLGAPVVAQGPQQRGGPPNQDTPYILVGTFRSTDRKLGTDMGDELRNRLQSEHSAKDLYVIPKVNIDNTLTASGYRPDSALNASDLMELAKQLRGEQVIDGSIEKAGSGVRVESRLLMKTGQQIVTQPLPTVDAKDPGDAAKQIERNISAASKAIPAYKLCTNDLRAAKYPEAIKDARTGLTEYPQSNLARLCILQAYGQQKAPADSIIAVASAIAATDPTSMIALANLADAYAAKGDTAKSIETSLKIYRLDPSNTSVATSIVQQLAQSGAPDKALPIIDSLLVNNPGDPNMLRTKWLLQLRAKQYKQAIATGEELAKVDTSVATLDYFQRMIGAAQSDSNAAAVQQLAARAGQRFPKDPSFPLLLAQSYRKSGQLQQALQAAERATQIDPKNTTAWLFAITIANEMNQPDSVLALAKAGVAAGASKDTLSQTILGPAGAAIKKAQESKSRDDWMAALKIAQTVDSIAPSPQSKYFIGVSSFQVATLIMDDVQAHAKAGATKKEERTLACSSAKEAEDMFATTSMAMPAGGAVDKDTAGKIMGAVQQYTDYIGQVKKAYCK